MKKYDLEYIESLRIHELRDLGKELNITAPTKMKKEELIERIREIIEKDNGMSPSFKNANETNEEHSIMELLMSLDSDLLEDFVEDDSNYYVDNDGSYIECMDFECVKDLDNHSYLEKDYNIVNSEYNFNFSVAQNKAEYDSSPGENDVSGYIDFHPMGYGILRANMTYFPSKNDILVPKVLINKYSIKPGELVKGKFKPLHNDATMKVLCEIYSIEGNLKKNKNVLFENIDKNDIFGPEYFLDKFTLEVLRGEIAYIYNMSLEEALDFAYDIVDQNLLNMKVFNVREKSQKVRNPDTRFDFINVDFGVAENDILSSIDLLCERIKREFENGFSNVLIINNFSELIRQINAAVNGYYDFEKISTITLKKIINLLNIAKYSKDKVASTIILVDKDTKHNDIANFFDRELLPRFDRVINYKDYK